ncbi:hypothetical protein V9T40_004004 [Parthenolecanium corni]|uniref:Proactivator polypeptide n=1 Tax=Parthenolecanium corni TaxID=536013 RepID=A0AAN9Y2S1_9HEMI
MILIRAILLFFCASVAYSRSSSDSNEFTSALVGPEFCGQGQVVWCSDFATAADCNAVKHCIQSVWLTHELLSNGESCDTCKVKIKRFRQGTASKTTKVVQELLASLCDLTRITDTLRHQCEEHVGQYVARNFDKLLDLLESDLDPSTICHLLHLCADAKPEITSSASAVLPEDDVVVRFENIVLHFPSKNFLNMESSPQLLGSSKCTWGPSYWCTDLISSSDCNATPHCIEKVWSNQQFDSDDDDICQLCKDTVKTARDEVTKNKTREVLLKVFTASCHLIPLEEVRKDCFKLTREFVTGLIDVLSSTLDPTGVCTIIKLCHNSEIDKALAVLQAQTPDPCVSCTAGMLGIEQFLKDAPQKSVLDILLRVCDQLSSFSDACSSLVTTNFVSIYETITKEMYPFPVCHLNGMCASQYHLHSSSEKDLDIKHKAELMLASNDSKLPCDLCKQFVKHFKKILTVNTTENEFREMLEGICKQSNRFEKDCLQIVEDSYDLFYKYLTEELHSGEFCRELSMCPKGNMVSDEGLYLITSPSSSASLNRVAEVPRQSIAGVECALCKKVIEVVQKEIDNPKYEHNIEKLLEEVCTLLPKKEQAKCDDFIQVYSDVLIKILANETDPGVVCSMMDICPNVLPIKAELCPLCRDIMNIVHNKLEESSVLINIEHLLEHVCGYLPKSKAASCKIFIDDYSELIIGVLAEEADPQLVCPALKLCPSLMSPLQRCTQCQHLMADFVKDLGSDLSEQNVVRHLRSLVPDNDMKLTALQLKVNYHDDIVEMMSAEFDPQESCVFLHFCEGKMISDYTSDAHDTENISGEVHSVEDVTDKATCEVCELMVNLFDSELTSNATEKEIERTMQKFCLQLRNQEMLSNCSHFVAEYVPLLLRHLREDVKPQAVCRVADLCPQLIDTYMNADEASSCELCEAVVGSVKGLTSDPREIRLSIFELIHLCELFYGNTKNQCIKVVSYVFPELESIALGIPSWYYCSKMDMCPYGAHLTFKRICTKPSAWCVDMKTALLCDKLSHCQKKVWKSEKPSLLLT